METGRDRYPRQKEAQRVSMRTRKGEKEGRREREEQRKEIAGRQGEAILSQMSSEEAEFFR